MKFAQDCGSAGASPSLLRKALVTAQTLALYPRLVSEQNIAMASEKLLQVLVCPLGKSELRDEGDALVCIRCGPRFRVHPQGYVDMLMEEAELPPGCRSLAQLPCQKERSHQP
jgi:hypothetical protein